MAITKKTTIEITKRPGPLGLLVETTPFKVYTMGEGWIAEEDVLYSDKTIDVLIVIRGQKGQEYAITIKLNSVEKEIKGLLVKDGKNRIVVSYPLSLFYLSL